MKIKNLLLGLAAFLLIILYSCKVSKVESEARPISHILWDSLLQQHVSVAGKVDYQGFIEDSTRLNDYLDLLSSKHPNDKFWTREERLAYWINVYNAFTVKLIVDHYPVQSIKDIKNGIPFVNSVWDIKFIQIEGETYDLNNIEHGIIRARFDDPRIHFAINCASVSCPNLSRRAYVAEQLDEQLDAAARAFLSDQSKNQLSEGQVKLSKIFLWYGMDFKKDGKSVVEYIEQFTSSPIDKGAKVEYMDYDWSLNE
jgi:hypothetical protein